MNSDNPEKWKIIANIQGLILKAAADWFFVPKVICDETNKTKESTTCGELHMTIDYTGQRCTGCQMSRPCNHDKES